MSIKSLSSLLLAIICTLPTLSHADVAAEVTALTGAHTRVVWVRDGGTDVDPLAERGELLLMGFDNKDGKGERAILSKPSSYFRPLITADGQKVVFSNVLDKKIYVVNWDGSGLKPVVENALFADVHTDPETGHTWIYAQTTAEHEAPSEEAWKALVSTSNSQEEISAVRRFRLDDPSDSEMVWDKSPVAQFQVSLTGEYASGSTGDGEGLFFLPNGDYHKFYGGCWPSMAPDGSHRVFVFNGSHRGAYVYTHNMATRAKNEIPLTFINAPGIPTSHESYHPRWGNHLQFMTVTGPYWYKDWNWDDEHKLSAEAAKNAEIYLGRLTKELDLSEAWVQITKNDVGDYYGDSWINLKENPQPAWDHTQAEGDVAAAPPAWPGNREGLVFLWENNAASNQIEIPETGKLDLCNLTPRQHALFGRHSVMETSGGSFVADDTRNEAILTALQKSNEFTLEAVITPAALDQAGATILSFGKNLWIEQFGDRLRLNLRSSGTGENAEWVELMTWKQGDQNAPPFKPVHIAVTYANGVTTAYRDGRQVGIFDKAQGDFIGWVPSQLVFGNNEAGDKNWAGSLEYVSLSNRRANLSEVSQRFAALDPVLKEREPLKPIVVQAKLIDTTAAPNPASITPYRRCLSVNVYEIENVESGELEDKRIMVAHWSILDAEVVPEFTKLVKGETYPLTIHPFDSHPELESERLVTDMEDSELPLFYDPNR